MGKIIGLIALLGIGAYVMKSCAVAESKSVPFTATWEHTQRNEMVGRTYTSTLHVKSDGKKFRVESTSTDPEWGSTTNVIMVFDGASVHRKSVSTDRNGNSDEPFIETKTLTKKEVKSMNFWKTVISPDAKAGPGGKIAGRDTVLYQMRHNRPDGKATFQLWLDEESNIMLKQVTSLYSKQAEQELTRDTYECTDFNLGDVEPSEFAKPI